MKRPRSVTIIGSLLLVQGVIFLSIAALLILIISTKRLDLLPPAMAEQFPPMPLRDLLFVATALVMGIFGVVSSIGLLRLRRWAWLMAMIVQGIGMIIGLIDYARGDPNYISMIFSVIVVFYLNQASIQEVFNVSRHQTNRRQNAEKRQTLIEEIPQERSIYRLRRQRHVPTSDE